MDDVEKYKYYKNSDFYFEEGILLNTFTRKPNIKYFQDLKENNPKELIEKLYNHIELSAVTADLEDQRKCAFEISKVWRKKLCTHFPDRYFYVDVVDNGYEITIYVYEYLK